MSEIVVKDLRPINELITIFQNQVLVVKGLPYSGKSTGIRNAAQEPMQAILQIDDLKKFLTEKRTSRTHLELPKDLTDHNIKEWKSCLRNLSQSNKNVIIEGRSYVVECLLGDEQLLHINQEKNIVTQIFSHLLTLKRTYVEGFQTYIFRLSRDDAKNYLDYFGLNSGYHNDILEYSSITIGKEQSHLALLLNKGIKIAVENPNYRESFGHIKKSEMELSIDQKQIGLFLVSQIPAFPAADAARIMQMISTSEALQDLSDSATAIISSISLAITPIVPFAALIPIALFAIRFANGYRNSSNKNQGVEQLVRFQRVWTKLSEERREIISYAYDQSLRLVPGTTAKAFNTLFYGTESQFREKIENVQVKMQDLNERISQMQQIIEIEFKAIKDGLLREKGIITDPIQLGLKLDNGILKCRSELGIDKEDYVEVVVSDEYQGLQQEISKKLQTDKTVILTGLKGIGKSILARHVIYDLLKNGFEILSLDRIHESRVNDTLGESRDRIIIYDPLSPELYLPRREIQGTEYSGLDVRSIVSRVRSLINFNVRALVVLPVDIWDQTKSTLISEITEYNIHEKLRTKDFLKGIITNYSSNCSPSISDLENFVNKLVTYESGYTLVAAYLGRWLYKSGCKVDDVNYALLQAQNQPIRFLQNFIWSVILRKNYDLTKRFVIPLLAHVSLGDMTPKMATDLPLSLPSQHLLVKT